MATTQKNEMRIVPIGTVRNASTYKVDGHTVVHSTSPAILEDTVYCVSCTSLKCVHVDAIRFALKLEEA